MKIKVEQHHIYQGMPKNGSCCPIALAVRNVTSNWGDIEIDTISSTIDGESYDMPNEADQFIEAFDKGLAVKPFEFEMKLNEHDLDNL